MAAEFQSKDDAALEISQLIYHLQVMMLALELVAGGRVPPSVTGEDEWPTPPKMAAVSSNPLIRIAVPNKGSLSEAAAQMLREAGYAQRNDPKELVLLDEANGVEFFYLRPRDIAVYVGEGTLDVGITGRDMLIDSGADADEVIPLGFGRSRFRFAAPVGTERTIEDLDQKRLATSYPGLVGGYLADRGVHPRLITLDGAVETAIRLGVADAIADVVETGHHPAAGRARAVRGPDPAVGGGADPTPRRRVADRVGPAAATVERRPGGAQLRDDGLRRQRRGRSIWPAPSPRGSSRRRWHRWPRRAGWPSGSWCPGPRRRRSWTTSGRSGPARSWSPTSRPVGSDDPERAAPGAHRPEPTGGLPVEPTAPVRHDRGARTRRAQLRVLGGPTGQPESRVHPLPGGHLAADPGSVRVRAAGRGQRCGEGRRRRPLLPQRTESASLCVVADPPGRHAPRRRLGPGAHHPDRPAGGGRGRPRPPDADGDPEGRRALRHRGRRRPQSASEGVPQQRRA